jgi:hypothetical protein
VAIIDAIVNFRRFLKRRNHSAHGTWAATGSLNKFHAFHTATLLLSGKVLVAGGPYTATIAELYNPGLGFAEDWRPQISSLNPSLLSGGRLTLSGVRFRGLSEASGGATNDSPTDYPLVQFRRLDNEEVFWLLPESAHPFSATSFVSGPVTDFANDHYLVTVFANAIPSLSGITRLDPAPVPPRKGSSGAIDLLLLD